MERGPNLQEKIMKMDDTLGQVEKDTGKVPNQKELEKELSEYLSKK